MKSNKTIRAAAVWHSILLVGIAVGMRGAASACTFQDETFDSYTNGSSMHGQGGWEGWENDCTDIYYDDDLVSEYS